MKGFKTFPFLIITVLSFAACTEEVAQELKKKQSSSSSSGDLSSSSIRLVHKMDSTLSFSMHKAGTMNSPCELSPPSSSGFDPQTYYTNPDDGAPNPAQVIDCVLEVQENDLHQHGAKFELQIDEQLCEYVTYHPYRFVEKQYGNSAKTVYQIECSENEETCRTGGYCDAIYDNYNFSGTANAASLLNPLEAPTCQFDYTDSDYGQNCDEGAITTVTLKIDNTAYDDDGDANTPEVCPSTPGSYSLTLGSSSTTDCEGDHMNCMGGPSIETVNDPSNTGIIYSNTDLATFVESWEVQAPVERNETIGNMYLANYSRICADNTLIKVDGFGDEDPSAYLGLELKGHQYENEIGGTTAQGFADAGGQLDYYAYAENPWRAVHTTVPYYSFSCLDKAKDVKAQIRLFIREWDRNYEGPYASFGLVSDIYSPTPMMDSNQTHDGRSWNNLWDWDDYFDTMDIWTDNQCSATATPYASGNFPGHL